MTKRRSSGEGSIYLRKDGRWVAAIFAYAPNGVYKRIQQCFKSRAEAEERLAELRRQKKYGLPIQDRQVKLATYLDYWLESFVNVRNRPKTYEQYESAVRLRLKPGLGKIPMIHLTVPGVQQFLNRLLSEGNSIRTVQVTKNVLSAALTRAMQEELLNRNVARLAVLPQYQRKRIQPWTEDEAIHFLQVARPHRLYPAFLMLVLYGLRRGEVLGLRWTDIDFERNEIHIRQQLQSIGNELLLSPVKTSAGERTLPLLQTVSEALADYEHDLAQDRLLKYGDAPYPQPTEAQNHLIFVSRSDTPIYPRNFLRIFWRICEDHGIRVIKLHHIRHTTATLLKDLGVPARDTQLILGHASAWTTSQIYQHEGLDSRRNQLQQLEDALLLLNTHYSKNDSQDPDGYEETDTHVLQL